jgi:hypothetical protein
MRREAEPRPPRTMTSVLRDFGCRLRRTFNDDAMFRSLLNPFTYHPLMFPEEVVDVGANRTHIKVLW